MHELLHGADYNYEQWLDYPDILKKDFEYMKKSGCNVMTIGIFSWFMLEPQEGTFQFQWLDNLFDELHRNGMKAILATPSGSKPIWLSLNYPEVCRVGRDGHREPHGYRHNHCRTSPVYRQKCVEINTLLANRYKNHPALLMWHVSNEYNAGPCFCDLCISEFREWLKEKYKLLETLNHAWWTTFWSHNYSDWNQIYPYDESIHGLMLDWKRFISDQTLDFFIEESKPLRQITPNIPVTTNFMLPNVGLDYWKFADHIDVISWDNYPQWHFHKEEWKEGVRTSFFHDLFRSLKDKSFMMMESTPNVTNWQGISIPKKTNMHLLSSLQAIAHGSDTVQYFQWRQSRGGSEKFHSAVIGHSAHCNTKVFQDVAAVGDALRSLKEIKNSGIGPEVVILYDFQSEWALDNAQLSRNVDKCYQDRCITHYQAFWRMGIPVDIKDSTHCDFSRYKIVIAPMLYMLRDNIACELEKFVAEGGIFVTTYLSGIVDESDLCFQGGAPGPLRSLLGLWVEDTDVLNDYHDQSLVLTDSVFGDTGISYKVKHYADTVHLETAAAAGSFKNDLLRGLPSIAVNQYGKGQGIYIASRNEDEFYQDFYRHLADSQNLSGYTSLQLPEGVTVQYRKNSTHLFIFFMNFTSLTVSVSLPEEYTEDILTKEKISDTLILTAYGIRIIKHKLE